VKNAAVGPRAHSTLGAFHPLGPQPPLGRREGQAARGTAPNVQPLVQEEFVDGEERLGRGS